MKTAKDILYDNISADIKKEGFTFGDVSSEYIIWIMQEFAKLHVEAALKAASENAKRKKSYNTHPQRLIVKRVVDKDSILKAYPLENIK